MFYKEDHITIEQEKALVDFIDQRRWRPGQRRMQTYGFRYFGQEMRAVEEIPEPLRLFDCNQLTINEYMPGVGIDEHYDHKERFGDTIIGLSLLSGITMIMKEIATGKIEEYYLKPRSLYKMTGDYRYLWTHRIKGVISDTVDGVEILRQRRISLTYRVVC